MTPTEFVAIVQDVWNDWAPAIVSIGGILAGAAVAMVVATRFGPAIVKFIFRR